MTSIFFTYFVAKHYVRKSVRWLEDGIWGLWNVLSETADKIISFLSTPTHEGATEEYADELHSVVEGMDRIPEVGLEADAIKAAMELTDALDTMQRSTLADFNTAVDAAIAEFVNRGEQVKVTDTGELLMHQLGMEVWRNEQAHQIRSLGMEFQEACRNS